MVLGQGRRQVRSVGVEIVRPYVIHVSVEGWTVEKHKTPQRYVILSLGVRPREVFGGCPFSQLAPSSATI